LEVKKRKKD